VIALVRHGDDDDVVDHVVVVVVRLQWGGRHG